jgi:hypothetical protein
MLKLPGWMIPILTEFAPVIYGMSTWYKVEVLVVGAILATGKRTVSAVMRVMGLSQETKYTKYHHVLNRAVWSGQEASEVLLRLLLKTFAKNDEPLVFGIDETIERRWGEKISARGIYRDPVRSSHSHFVKASGLRWMCLMWLTEMSWAQRIWALPFFTVLAPSERYYTERQRAHKKLTDWARQMVLQLRRWLPEQALIVVGDSSYAVLDFLHHCQTLAHPVTVITRLRLDAAVYEPAPSYSGRGRPRKKGKRLPTPQQILKNEDTLWTRMKVLWYDRQERELELFSTQAVWFHYGLPAVPIRYVLIRDRAGKFAPQALLSTDLTLSAEQILAYFMRRWQMETTFQQVRSHLGVETQRQWSDKAIARTTPILMGLFSLVTLLANTLILQEGIVPRTAAWYSKTRPTFSDALALVRSRLWAYWTFHTSLDDTDMVKVPRVLLERFNDLLAYAA